MDKEKKLMRLLKVNTLSFLIARTNLGDFCRVLGINDTDYHYTLDSVPLDKDKQADIIKLYTPKKETLKKK